MRLLYQICGMAWGGHAFRACRAEAARAGWIWYNIDMSSIPPTSVSLLRDISSDPQSERWSELYRRYCEPMFAFARAKFPTLETEDLVQETMAALVERMPGYKYLPDEKGHFRNYLMGILKHKAMDALNRRSREAAARKGLRDEPRPEGADADDSEWRAAALEVAIEQLMADKSVNALHRTVFRRVALMRERPEDVAREFGISRGNVDVIKKRLLERLGESVRRLVGA